MKDLEKARKVGEYLEKACGWQVFGNEVAVKCVCGESVCTNYCPKCGRKNEAVGKDAVEQIAAAIRFAEEDK